MSTSSTHTSLDSALKDDLRAIQRAGLDRHLRLHTAATDFSSNDYLALARDPRLAEAVRVAVAAHGVGAGAARLISGNNPEHEALERELAAWLGAERTLLFGSGYLANTGIIPALVGRGDVIYSDELNHASVIDGCRLSRADVRVYPHADVDRLAAMLATSRGDYRRALVATDGVFSMDGDTAPLADVADLARRYDAWTYVDDAHAIGVTGESGRGSTETLGVDVVVGTLGKAFGCAGAFVSGSTTLIEYLLNRARTFVFSTAMLPAQAAAGRAALGIIQAEPWRRERIHENARALREGLEKRGIAPLGDRTSHIVPVAVGDTTRTMTIGRRLAERGLIVGAIRPPTVPDGSSRLRITVNAAHALEQIERLAQSLAVALRAE